jgi:hypothetical protein
MVLTHDLIHLMILLLKLVDLPQLLKLMLVLHLLLDSSILHIGCDKTGLGHKLFPLLLKSLLLEVRDQHPCLLSLLVQETANRPLDLDGCQVLSCHWPAPWLLNYTLQNKKTDETQRKRLTL